MSDPMKQRLVLGITVRVAVDAYCGGDGDAHSLLHTLRRLLDECSDGRRPFPVELMLDGAQRVTEMAAPQHALAVRALDGDSTVDICSFPTVKTREAYAVETLRARDASGRAWLSEAEYRESAANDLAWSLLQKRMGYGLRPEGVTRQDILQAAALLQLRLPKET